MILSIPTGFCFEDEVTLAPGEVFTITSPGYPGFYPPGLTPDEDYPLPDSLYCAPLRVITSMQETIALRLVHFETELIYDLLLIKVMLISFVVLLFAFKDADTRCLLLTGRKGISC